MTDDLLLAQVADDRRARMAELERQLAEVQAEAERLLDIVQREPHTAYLEAVQRACDENMVALKHASREAGARAEEAERQLAAARAALEHDRTAVADGLAAIRKVIAGQSWLREAGRGSYAWDDERYQQEFGHALDEIEAAMQPLAKIAKDWSNCPTDPDEIARARADTELATSVMLDERKRRVAAERQLAEALAKVKQLETQLYATLQEVNRLRARAALQPRAPA